MKNYHELKDVPRRFKEVEPERDEYIHNEILVDTYGNDEVTSAWYYYLEEKLGFPFTAMVITHRSRQMGRSVTISSSQVEILDMAPLSRCGYNQMWVIGIFFGTQDKPVHFFLSDITQVEPGEERETALVDWLYWNRHQSSEIWLMR